MNAIKNLTNSVVTLNNKIDSIAYWSHPANWAKSGWHTLNIFFNSGNADIYLLVGTIAAIWLVMLGAKKTRTYLFWGWIVFWLLRAVVFV